jgi:hypothetical protein
LGSASGCASRSSTTTPQISFCGGYRNARGRRIRARTAPAITFWHSKAHRPDLKQLLFILTMSADGNVPVAFRCTDGNNLDAQRHAICLGRLSKSSSTVMNSPRSISEIAASNFLLHRPN